MQQLRVNCVLFSISCVTQINADYRKTLSNAIQSFLGPQDNRIIGIDSFGSGTLRIILEELELIGLERLFVCETSEEAVLADLKAMPFEIRRNLTISVGAVEHDMAFRQLSQLHFHVGSRESLPVKVRHVIPVTDQYDLGLTNILTHFSEHSEGKMAWQCKDIIDFVQSAGEHYRRPEWGSTLMQKAIDFSNFVFGKFPDEIAGLFGTGFPFYAFDGDFSKREISVPNSVLKYFDEQHSYFSQKSLAESAFLNNYNKRFSIRQIIASLGILIERNTFDSHQYDKGSVPCPSIKQDGLRLAEYYALNAFDISSDPWPCQFCAPLQLPEIYPRQQVIKKTNTSCLECNQTSMMLRNVMGAACDIDVVIAVRGDIVDTAEAIERAIIEDGTYHLYEMEMERTLINHDGPVDIFIFGVDDLLSAMQQLSTSDWATSTTEAAALWCPISKFEANLGLCFPLSFEPIILNDQRLEQQIIDSRKMFAAGAGPEEVVEVLRDGSFWTYQLMGNCDLVDAFIRRLITWRSSEMELSTTKIIHNRT